jgi:WD40 repeat protein
MPSHEGVGNDDSLRDATPPKKDVTKRNLKGTHMDEIKWDPDGMFRENPYYLKIAKKYMIVKYVTIVLALAFAVTMMTAFSEDITSENFQYLIKDLDLSGLSSGDDFDTLLYNGGAESSFGIYRGELVIVSPGTVSLYKSSAALSLSKSNIYYAPVLHTSDKYFLVYDQGETSRSYSIFNSFAELKTETLPYPITGADLADNGTYAIVTRDETYRGIVRVYDGNFRNLFDVKKDKYILSVDLSDDGKTLAIASVYDKGGNFVTELTTVRVDDKETDITVTEEGLMPLKVQFMDGGTIGVLYTDRAILYRDDGTVIATHSYSAVTSVCAAISDSYLIVAYNTDVIGNDKTVEIVDADGKNLYCGQLSGELLRIAHADERICFLFEDHAVMVDLAEGTTKRIDIEPNAIDVVFAGDSPLICYSGNAISLDFDKNGIEIKNNH